MKILRILFVSKFYVTKLTLFILQFRLSFNFSRFRPVGMGCICKAAARCGPQLSDKCAQTIHSFPDRQTYTLTNKTLGHSEALAHRNNERRWRWWPKLWMRQALTNRKDKEFGEAGDRTPLGLNEATVDAEDDGLDVFRANGTGS